MFAKLLKHEWLASRRTLNALNIATLAAGIMGAVVLRILVNEETVNAYASDNSWAFVVLIIGMMFVFFGLIGCVMGSEIYVVTQFYKSKFTDEGYLTFTLPATSRQIFLASFAHIALRTMITIVVMSVAILIMFFGGLWGTGEFAQEFQYGMPSFPKLADAEIINLLLSLLSSILSFVASIVVIMTCVTVGAVLAKKHKLMAAIGIYYLYSMAYSVVSTMVMVSSITDSDLRILLLLEIGLQGAAAVIGFLLSTYLMDKKLNLP